MDIRIENAAAMRHGQTRVFEFPTRYGPQQGFVIRFGGGFYAYLNQCQHWPIPLDIGDADFFHEAIDRIRCKTHGAIYHPETGYCEAGPCARSQLDAFPLVRAGNDVIVTVPDAPAQSGGNTASVA